jgi:carboxypeptidase C (cathepsin A)
MRRWPAFCRIATEYLNGLVMISSVWDLGTISFYPGEDLSYILYLPSYAATAWYHKLVTDRPENLISFLEEARSFAKGEYAAALLKGSALPSAEKSAVAKKMAHYTGLSEEYILKSDLRVKQPQFMQELQRSRGLTTGRLDARFSGPTYNLVGEFADYDPQEAAISGAFVAAFNMYMREELKFSPDREYHIFANFGDNRWDWKHQAETLRFSRLAQCDAGFGGCDADQHQTAGGNGRWHLRPGDAIYGGRIFNRTPGIARVSAEKHPSQVLRSRPHDVFAR